MDTRPMYFKTAAEVLRLRDSFQNQDVFRDMDRPVVVFHAPDDQTVLISGSRRLVEESATDDATLVELPEMSHNLMINCPEQLAAHTIPWILRRCNKTAFPKKKSWHKV